MSGDDTPQFFLMHNSTVKINTIIKRFDPYLFLKIHQIPSFGALFIKNHFTITQTAIYQVILMIKAKWFIIIFGRYFRGVSSIFVFFLI